ncbi:MAG: tetratricopeptide repeat protein [Vicinamibacterales bacterium]
MSATPTAVEPRHLWVWRPSLDLVVGCGAWSLPVLTLVAATGRSDSALWSVVFYQLALVSNYPHYMATLHRAYRTREDAFRYRLVTCHATLALLLVGVAAHVRFDVLPWVFTAYVTWSPWHYSGQNFGLLMMFARRAGLDPSPGERRALHAAFVTSYVMLAGSVLTGTQTDPLVLTLGAASSWRPSILAVLTPVYIGLASFAVWRFRRRLDRWTALWPVLTLLATQTLWFVVPLYAEWLGGWRLPPTRYSTGALAVLHSAQYLWITSYYASRDHRGPRPWSATSYFLGLVTGGMLLFIPGPWLASTLLQRDFTVSMLVFTALINIHHFILDGTVWKLRDTRVARWLLGRETAESEVASEPAMPLAWSALWERASAWSRWRPARVAVVIAIVALVGVDQLRYLLAVDGGRVATLQAAVALNPHDSAAQLRLAGLAAADKQDDLAIAALREAVATSPGNPGPAHALGRLLIARDRRDDALAHYEAMVQTFPRDADAWVNLGILADRVDDANEAEEAWTTALGLRPDQARVHLYLATLLERRGKRRDSLSHYRDYLQAVASRHETASPAQVVAVLVRFGDGLATTGDEAYARLQYEAAVRLATQTAQPALRLHAYLRLAALEEQVGSPDAALGAFRRALAESADVPATDLASAWAALGGFCSRAGRSSRWALACALEAVRLDPTSAAAAEIATLDAQMGRDASLVRASRESIVAEVLGRPEGTAAAAR